MLSLIQNRNEIFVHCQGFWTYRYLCVHVGKCECICICLVALAYLFFVHAHNNIRKYLVSTSERANLLKKG